MVRTTVYLKAGLCTWQEQPLQPENFFENTFLKYFGCNCRMAFFKIHPSELRGLQ